MCCFVYRLSNKCEIFFENIFDNSNICIYLVYYFVIYFLLLNYIFDFEIRFYFFYYYKIYVKCIGLLFIYDK